VLIGSMLGGKNPESFLIAVCLTIFKYFMISLIDIRWFLLNNHEKSSLFCFQNNIGIFPIHSHPRRIIDKPY
jgi:hypothetical protein